MNAHQNYRTFLNEMNNAFIDRTAEVEILGTALVAEENAVLVGPPGTGKSLLAEAFAKALQEKFFSYLITRYTTPDELLGHFSLKELKDNDQYVRQFENKLPDCSIAFLDEVFKASSALLNSLLTILNERKVDLGNGVRQKTPLKMVIGASNEYPFQDESLGALWDRWLFRKHVNPLRKPDHIIRLITDKELGNVLTKLDADDLVTLRQDRDNVDLSDVAESIIELHQFLLSKEIYVSPRRWRKVAKVIQSRSIMEGRSKATTKDMRILSDVLWNKPEQRDQIAGFLANLCSGELLEVMKLHDAACEIIDTTNLSEEIEQNLSSVARKNKLLQQIAKDAAAKENGDPEISEYIAKINNYSAAFKKALRDALS